MKHTVIDDDAVITRAVKAYYRTEAAGKKEHGPSYSLDAPAIGSCYAENGRVFLRNNSRELARFKISKAGRLMREPLPA